MFYNDRLSKSCGGVEDPPPVSTGFLRGCQIVLKSDFVDEILRMQIAKRDKLSKHESWALYSTEVTLSDPCMGRRSLRLRLEQLFILLRFRVTIKSFDSLPGQKT